VRYPVSILAKKKTILDRGSLVFLQALQVMFVQYGIRQTSLKLLPNTILDNIYSFITPPFDIMYSELLTVSLNKW